jgi:preprotein translocase subunit YajC
MSPAAECKGFPAFDECDSPTARNPDGCALHLVLLGGKADLTVGWFKPPSNKKKPMFATPAYAQAAATATTGGPAAFLLQIFPLVAIFAIFWFLMFRPQQKAMKAHKAKIEAVKKGDTVVTGGGLVGKATKVDDQFVEIEIASGVKVKAVKSTLSDVTPLGGAKPAND